MTSYTINPSGNAVFDAAARATLEASKGKELPPPPENYPDVVQMLQQAKTAGALTSRFRVNALPEPGREFNREEPQVEPRSVDLVVCREVLEHMTVLQVQETVQQICRASSP